MSRAREVSKIVATSNSNLNTSITTASAAAVSALVNGAPAALDTLNELSTALQNDSNFYNTVANTYLSQSSASTNYLTQSSASNTYLDKSSASSTYIPQSSPAVGLKNKIINGDFRIWQRGTSFSNPASNSYTADRFMTNSNAGTPTTYAITRESFTLGISSILGVEADYFYRSTITTVGTCTRCSHSQKIEDVKTFSGQRVTVSFWAKADSSRSTIVYLLQNFGTGGSSQVVAGSTTASITTSWTKFSFTSNVPSMSGKTIGTGSNIEVRFDQVLAAGSILDIWGVQVEKGSIATDFEERPIGTELALCQRYYEKSYALTTNPGTSGAGITINGFSTSSAQKCIFPGPWKVQKRITPSTVTVYDAVGNASKISTLDAGGTATNNIAIAIIVFDDSSFRALGANNGTQSGYVYAWTADAEL